jgi:hypothetical protein
MNEYRCTSCAALAYSSASAPHVSACPRCFAPLAPAADNEQPVTPEGGQR